MKKIFDKIKYLYNFIIKIFNKTEEAFLVLLLSILIGIAILQIILRIFSRSISWFDEVIKYSVLWIGFVAASLAARENKHIKIDIIGKFVKGRAKSIILIISNIASSIVSIILCVFSIIYLIKIEYTSNIESPFLNIRRWILLIIIPVGFGIMGLRFFIKFLKKIRNFIINKEEDDLEENLEFNK
jgi:TRAP-type C4-dicarboxylate transport system permease small subunit